MDTNIPMLTNELLHAKGQIKPKTDWRAVDSPKKRICLFAFLLFTANKTNSFFGRIYFAPKLLLVLSDLYLLPYHSHIKENVSIMKHLTKRILIREKLKEYI